MDEIIWVEVLSRHRDVLARHRCAGPEIRIGRGYDNDVVIDDPYVAACHVRIARDESGAWVAEDFGSANGLFADHETQKRTRITLDGDHPIRIGHTYLRLRDARHPVPRERIIEAPARRWPLLLGLAIALLGIEALGQWLVNIGEPKLSQYATPLLGVILIMLGWPALWAILSRIFAGRARFESHLLITLAGLLCFSLYSQFGAFAGFALSWWALAAYQYVALLCLLAVACFVHLRVIGPTRLRLKGGIVAALLGIAVALQAISQAEQHANSGGQYPAHRLMPPSLRLTPLRDENTFFADVERLKGKLDKARQEAPPSVGPDAGGGD